MTDPCLGACRIRDYRPADQRAVEEITYRTGFSGLDLTGRGVFDDAHLFFLLFTGYYLLYEPEHCFVAADGQTDRAVGFVLGTEDTRAQERAFQKMIPRIIPHLLGVTLFRHPRTLFSLRRWYVLQAEIESHGADPTLAARFPAHLHINLLPEYQGLGIGGRLIRHYEAHLRRDGVRGVHLQTSNHNHKALPFYAKMGYQVMRELRLAAHPWFPDYALVTFAKILTGSPLAL